MQERVEDAPVEAGVCIKRSGALEFTRRLPRVNLDVCASVCVSSQSFIAFFSHASAGHRLICSNIFNFAAFSFVHSAEQ